MAVINTYKITMIDHRALRFKGTETDEEIVALESKSPRYSFKYEGTEENRDKLVFLLQELDDVFTTCEKE